MGTPLSQLTTIGVGGEPAQLHVCRTREELIQLTLEVWRSGDPWLILGGGSNVVASDDLGDLQVIQVATQGVTKLGDGHVRVEAGHSWDALVEQAVNSGWGGVESLSGIPGTVGAAPIQNIGAYGQEVAMTLTRVEFLDYLTRELVVLGKEDLGFGYRDSIFKHGRQGLITWVEFQFVTDLPAGSTALMKQRRDEVLGQRAAKGMLLNPADSDTRSCGSFFVNPIVSDKVARTLPFEAPKWESEEDDGLTVKLSAAWLIENAGVPKGFQIAGSGAAISSKHTLAITNRGGATAADVLQLKTFVQERVAARWGINLRPEPVLVGFDED